jgi:NAD(P)-dependent dehydrogenase (short-subunit alcohol dehydrogenase family)
MRLEHLATRYGPWAVVTGASSGIGRAFAETLAGAGPRTCAKPRDLLARRGDVTNSGASLREGVLPASVDFVPHRSLDAGSPHAARPPRLVRERAFRSAGGANVLSLLLLLT